MTYDMRLVFVITIIMINLFCSLVCEHSFTNVIPDAVIMCYLTAGFQVIIMTSLIYSLIGNISV